MRPQGILILPQWFLFILLLFSTSSRAKMVHKVPRLDPLPPKFLRDPSKTIASSSSVSLKDFQTKYYQQTLDHFNYGLQSYATFKQKYVTNSKYWGGANSSSPILAYLGAESPLSDDHPLSIGSLTDNASRFKALLVYMEVLSIHSSTFYPIEHLGK